MQCGTCKEAKSEQLPASEVCRQCHEFSKWCQATPNYRKYEATVTLHLCQDEYGLFVVSTFNTDGTNVISQKTISVCFEVPE